MSVYKLICGKLDVNILEVARSFSFARKFTGRKAIKQRRREASGEAGCACATRCLRFGRSPPLVRFRLSRKSDTSRSLESFGFLMQSVNQRALVLDYLEIREITTVVIHF